MSGSAAPTYDFDAPFQTKIAALVLRDTTFNDRTIGLIDPGYFENAAESALVGLVLRYYQTYKQAPDAKILIKMVKEAIARKIFRGDLVAEVSTQLGMLLREDISDRDYVIDSVSEFAQLQAMKRAMLSSLDHLEKRDLPAILKEVNTALQVGKTESPEYDFFEEIENRTQMRKEMLAGNIAPKGITTGYPRIDELLYHKGWGREELSVWMGGAKTGKTTFLMDSAIAAVAAGYNVLHVTCEVSRDVLASRADASIADMLMGDVRIHPHKVRDAIKLFWGSRKTGAWKIHEYPSGTFTPGMMRGLIERYRAKGIQFDLVCIDYLDIMRPNYRTNDPIENSKAIWIDVRAVAQEENIALLSATQTNRTGFQSATSRAEHVADDFNKIRTADLVISINKTEDEAKRNEARLFFAASRNQRWGFTIHVQQDLERMKPITRIIGID